MLNRFLSLTCRPIFLNRITEATLLLSLLIFKIIRRNAVDIFEGTYEHSPWPFRIPRRINDVSKRKLRTQGPFDIASETVFFG